VFEDLRGILAGDQEIQIADSVLFSSQAAGWRYSTDAGDCSKIGLNLLRKVFDAPQQMPRPVI
jgi:hypothetical protein